MWNVLPIRRRQAGQLRSRTAVDCGLEVRKTSGIVTPAIAAKTGEPDAVEVAPPDRSNVTFDG